MKDTNICNFKLLEGVVIVGMIKLGAKRVFAQIMEKTNPKKMYKPNYLYYFVRK
jgi:hypothetical protein